MRRKVSIRMLQPILSMNSAAERRNNLQIYRKNSLLMVLDSCYTHQKVDRHVEINLEGLDWYRIRERLYVEIMRQRNPWSQRGNEAQRLLKAYTVFEQDISLPCCCRHSCVCCGLRGGNFEFYWSGKTFFAQTLSQGVSERLILVLIVSRYSWNQSWIAEGNPTLAFLRHAVIF